MFCPSCGEEKEKEIGKICLDCFISDKELVKIPDYLDVEYCVKCDSFKEEGSWREPTNKEISKLEAAESAVMSSLGVHKEIKNPKISLAPDVSGDQISFDIEVFGEIQNKSVLLNATTKVRLDKTTCKRCSKIAGGYFESIIQVRGEDRELGDNEIEKIKEKIFDVTNDSKERKRMSFVGEVKDKDGGLDVYVGTSELGQRISRMLISDFGGTFSRSSSLIGMKDGQEVHRVTYAVRLPPFSVGDIIELEGELIGIQKVGDVIEGVNIKSGEPFRRDWKYIKDSEIKKIGEKEDIEEGTISLIKNGEVQVVEPWKYNNLLLKKPSFLKKEDEGKKIPLLRHKREFYLLPKSFLSK